MFEAMISGLLQMVNANRALATVLLSFSLSFCPNLLQSCTIVFYSLSTLSYLHPTPSDQVAMQTLMQQTSIWLLVLRPLAFGSAPSGFLTTGPRRTCHIVSIGQHNWPRLHSNQDSPAK